MNLPERTLDHLSEIIGRPDLSGTTYELLGLVGRGGMGTVYRARDARLGREVALKVIDLPLAGTPLSEARMLAQLEHPGIVPLYDAGQLPDGRSFFVVRMVEGRRLDEFLQAAPPLSERLEVFTKLCETVSFAHSQGVVHRDLKLENVIAGAFGQVIVLDWGVALLPAEPGAAGVVAGTPRTMAPEQARGAQVDRRADIYSLGVLLRDMLPESPPRPLSAIADKAARPEPQDRYRQAEEIVADVRRYRDALPVSCYRETPRERLARFARRNRVFFLLLGVYIAVRVLLFILRRA
jgi:eukaryotic-like serine/threonine-protein kinase